MIHYFPNLKPTPALAYVVGALRGDGSVKQGRITLMVREKDFAEEFAKNFSSVLNVRVEPKRYEKWRVWCVSRRSKLFYDWFANLPPTPRAVEQFPRSYLRGFFDAEGFARINSKGSLVSFVEVRLTNANFQFLKTIKKLLEKLNIPSTLYLMMRRGQEFPSKKVKRDIYALSITRVGAVWRFLKEIGFSIQKKNQVLVDGLRRFIEKPRMIKTYDKAMRLRERKLGEKRISEMLVLPLGTVNSWLYQGVKPHSYDLIKEMENSPEILKPFEERLGE